MSYKTLFGPVPQNWVVCKLSEIAQFRQGLQISKSERISQKASGYIPLLKVTDLPKGIFSEYVTNIRENYIATKNDVIYTRTGIVGEVYTNVTGCVHNNCFKVITSPDIIDKNYLYYYLNSKQVKDYSNSVAAGSVQKDLNHGAFGSLVFAYPPLKNQIKIANILSSLDEKIELNNKINKNLEELAQTLYKRWFVDFEFPNENGEPYKTSGGEMVDSELGMIPKGWGVKKQGTYFPVITGKKNANVATQEGKFKFFTCSQQIYRTDGYSFEGDAILIAGNGDFNVKYYSGKFEAYQRTYVLIPYNPKLSGLLFTAIKHNLSNITTGFRGSVINFITKGHIDDYLVTFPDEEKLEPMAALFKDMVDTIALNNEQNEKLAKTRDELLPKLMSGEIEVLVEE